MVFVFSLPIVENSKQLYLIERRLLCGIAASQWRKSTTLRCMLQSISTLQRKKKISMSGEVVCRNDGYDNETLHALGLRFLQLGPQAMMGEGLMTRKHTHKTLTFSLGRPGPGSVSTRLYNNGSVHFGCW